MLLPKHSEGWFLLIFLGLFAPGCVLAFLSGKGDALAVVSFMEAAAVVSAAAAFVIVEGTMLLAERYLKKRFEEGKKEGKKEGKEEGREEGKLEGLTEGIQKGLEKGKEEGKLEMWQDYMREWERRRDEAEEQGLEFTEPPPPKPE